MGYFNTLIGTTVIKWIIASMKRAWVNKYLTKNHHKMLFNKKGSKFNKKSSKTIVHGSNL